jgi:predicted transcriptional regulator
MHITSIAKRPVGPAIAARRQLLGLSREELGARADGVSVSAIRRIELGLVEPHRSTVAALIRALDPPAR